MSHRSSRRSRARARSDSCRRMSPDGSSHGVDDVGWQHQKRHADLRRGQRLGDEDRLPSWSKPARPAWLDAAASQQGPDRLHLRERRGRVRRKGLRPRRLLVLTPLLMPTTCAKEEMAALYRCRWHAELALRAIKTALGMDSVRPDTFTRRGFTSPLLRPSRKCPCTRLPPRLIIRYEGYDVRGSLLHVMRKEDNPPNRAPYPYG